LGVWFYIFSENDLMYRFSLMAIALACSPWMGCGSGTTTTTSPDGKTSVAEKNGDKGVTVNGTINMASSGGEVALPEGFPNDIPIYTGGKVISGVKTDNNLAAVVITGDAVKNVGDFYLDKLKTNGWDIQTSANTSDGGMVLANKGNLTCTIGVTRANNTTTISLGVTAKR
jgi:hypothetical protein